MTEFLLETLGALRVSNLHCPMLEYIHGNVCPTLGYTQSYQALFLDFGLHSYLPGFSFVQLPPT